MTGFAAIIDAFGGPRLFALEVGIPDSHARAMKTRNSIAPLYWPSVVAAGRRRGIGITEEMLLVLYARRWPRARRRVA